MYITNLITTNFFLDHTTPYRTDFPPPDMVVSCLADGVLVKIHITESRFNGVLYVKGHSKEEECRKVVNLNGDETLDDTDKRTELFKVQFGNCGLIHDNGIANFILVIQKHPKLVTYKAQAYNIKCVYQTGEKNVTLGFNVSMLTTAGTIANTGPPPVCQMRIVTQTGQEINSAEIGDNLMLQVDIEPASKLLMVLVGRAVFLIKFVPFQRFMEVLRDPALLKQWSKAWRTNT